MSAVCADCQGAHKGKLLFILPLVFLALIFPVDCLIVVMHYLTIK